jgi:hypothetical protein
LKTISTDVKERISAMRYLFAAGRLVMIDHSITAIYCSLIKAKGSIWHKSSMKKGIAPRSGIDTDARWWGYSHTKGWVFEYKLHLTPSTLSAGEIVVLLTANITIASAQDNPMYFL